MPRKVNFEWDNIKDKENKEKHGVSFAFAQHAFADHNRIILKDMAHSVDEDRFYCIGKVGDGILTVRFTYRNRNKKIRIFGAGYWRKGKKIYERENKIY